VVKGGVNVTDVTRCSARRSHEPFDDPSRRRRCSPSSTVHRLDGPHRLIRGGWRCPAARNGLAFPSRHMRGAHPPRARTGASPWRGASRFTGTYARAWDDAALAVCRCSGGRRRVSDGPPPASSLDRPSAGGRSPFLHDPARRSRPRSPDCHSMIRSPSRTATVDWALKAFKRRSVAPGILNESAASALREAERGSPAQGPSRPPAARAKRKPRAPERRRSSAAPCWRRAQGRERPRAACRRGPGRAAHPTPSRGANRMAEVDDMPMPAAPSGVRWTGEPHWPSAKQRTGGQARRQTVCSTRSRPSRAPPPPPAGRPGPALQRIRSPRGCILQGPTQAISVSWFPTRRQRSLARRAPGHGWRGVLLATRLARRGTGAEASGGPSFPRRGRAPTVGMARRRRHR
jgi:hypothetical protein